MSEKVSLASLPPTPPGLDVPSEAIPLPSEGRIYPKDSPLHGAATIDIRAMTAREEDILTSRSLLKTGRAISMLLRNCVMDKSIDVDKMLAGDRNAALIGIRISGYGADYKTTIICPQCGEKVERTIDLSALPIKRMPAAVRPVVEGSNEFEYTLPVSKRRVTFKLMTGEDERELLQIIERTRKMGLEEALVTTRLKAQVLSIGAEQDPNKLAAMISSMPARDSRELRQHIDRISPGVELKVDFTCPACDLQSPEVEVPLGTEFFWPQS